MEGSEQLAEGIAALGALVSIAFFGILIVGFVINLLVVVAILRTWSWSARNNAELRKIASHLEYIRTQQRPNQMEIQ